MASTIHNLSIKRKQVLIIMLTSSVALLLACAAFVAYDTITFRNLLVKKESSVADVVGKTVTAAIDFNDSKTAEESLAALRAEPNIVSACIYDSKGNVFATYRRDNDHRADGFPALHAPGYEFAGGRLRIFHDITQGDGRVGAIFVSSDLDELSQRLENYAGIVGLVFLVSLLIALGLSSRLQRLISGPVLHLAQVARSVALEKNYSLRAEKQSHDELGQLVECFNEMLAQIQQRDAALQTARDSLEQRVVERTDELASSRSLYQSLVNQLPAGVFRKDRAGRYVFVNSWYCQIKNMAADQIVGKTPAELAASELAGHYVQHPETAIETRLAAQGCSHHELITETGRRIEVEEDYPGINGKKQHLHVIKSPVFGPDGSITGSQGMLFDVTDRKRAEAELSYERDLLGTLLDNFPDSIYFKDLQSRFVRLSRSKVIRTFASCLERHRTVSGSDPLPAHLENLEQFSTYILGKSDFDFLPEKTARELYAGEQEIIRTGIPLIGKMDEFQRPDGTVAWTISTKMLWKDRDGKVIGTFGTTKDITTIKEAEVKVAEAHRQLLEISRQAGMAEVATSVLHNVGNVLNSINVSAALVADNAKKSRTSYLVKAVTLLNEHTDDLGAFMTADPKGRQLPGYLGQLATQLVRDQQDAITELDLLRQNIEHVKDIVAMQQSYAKISGVTETVKVPDLIDDALRMNSGALARHEIKLIRAFTDTPPIIVEKHKVLQILVNLIRNAKYACDDSGRKDKELIIRISKCDQGVQIAVVDNGIGIPPENLVRIFNHGFTTRKGGHGFGLHSGALAARELGGTLTVQSEGHGRGAVFILTLPLHPPQADL